MTSRSELTYIPLGVWLNCSSEQRAQLRAELGPSLVLDVSDLSTSMDAMAARLTEECQKDYDEEREENDSAGLSVEKKG